MIGGLLQPLDRYNKAAHHLTNREQLDITGKVLKMAGLADRKQNERDSKRRMRNRQTQNADWERVSGELLTSAIGCIARNGGALRLGYSRDGGAYAVGVYGDGEPYTLWGADDMGLITILEDVIESFGEPGRDRPTAQTTKELP